MAFVNKGEIIKRLADLGLERKNVGVHSSLSSFGNVEEGANAVIDVLMQVCDTILMPSFSELGRTGAPENNHPLQNGTDYNSYKADYTVKPMDLDSFDNSSHIDEEIGIIPKTFLTYNDVIRSKHPSVYKMGTVY